MLEVLPPDNPRSCDADDPVIRLTLAKAGSIRAGCRRARELRRLLLSATFAAIALAATPASAQPPDCPTVPWWDTEPNDFYYLDAKKATHLTLAGRSDFVYSQGPRDTIIGQTANDVIDGGPGRSTIIYRRKDRRLWNPTVNIADHRTDYKEPAYASMTVSKVTWKGCDGGTDVLARVGEVQLADDPTKFLTKPDRIVINRDGADLGGRVRLGLGSASFIVKVGVAPRNGGESGGVDYAIERKADQHLADAFEIADNPHAHQLAWADVISVDGKRLRGGVYAPSVRDGAGFVFSGVGGERYILALDASRIGKEDLAIILPGPDRQVIAIKNFQPGDYGIHLYWRPPARLRPWSRR